MMTSTLRFRLPMAAAVLLGMSTITFSCLPKSASVTATPDDHLQSLLTSHGLDGDPIEGLIFPSISDPLAQLGKRLFFSKALGGSFDSACASCHHPRLGGGDALALSIGTDAVDPDLLGPLREHAVGSVGFDGGPTVPRNSPTIFNVALWRESLFWDGRVQTVEGGIVTPDSPHFLTTDPLSGETMAAAQARFPVTSEEEMRGFTFEFDRSNTQVRNHLAARIGNYGIGAGEVAEDWESLFRTAFDDAVSPVEDLVTFENIVAAIGAYENSQVFVDTPWKSYVEGDLSVISASAKRGAILFLRQPEVGGAACFECHSGDFFTDEQYHLTGFPQIGPGTGMPNELGDVDADYGRGGFVGGMLLRFSYRTPSLINVEMTGPWGHAGSFSNLETLLRYHVDPINGFSGFDLGDLAPGVQVSGFLQNTGEAMEQLILQRAANTLALPADVALSDQDYADLVAFLFTLTDPRLKDPDALEPWIARNDAEFTDSHMLLAHDGAGEVY